jgi:hypothetical protein
MPPRLLKAFCKIASTSYFRDASTSYKGALLAKPSIAQSTSGHFKILFILTLLMVF